MIMSTTTETPAAPNPQQQTVVMELLAEPPPERDYIATGELANFLTPDGQSLVGRRYVGRKKATGPVWALLPRYTLN